MNQPVDKRGRGLYYRLVNRNVLHNVWYTLYTSVIGFFWCSWGRKSCEIQQGKREGKLDAIEKAFKLIFKLDLLL